MYVYIYIYMYIYAYVCIHTPIVHVVHVLYNCIMCPLRSHFYAAVWLSELQQLLLSGHVQRTSLQQLPGQTNDSKITVNRK